MQQPLISLYALTGLNTLAPCFETQSSVTHLLQASSKGGMCHPLCSLVPGYRCQLLEVAQVVHGLSPQPLPVVQHAQLEVSVGSGGHLARLVRGVQALVVADHGSVNVFSLFLRLSLCNEGQAGVVSLEDSKDSVMRNTIQVMHVLLVGNAFPCRDEWWGRTLLLGLSESLSTASFFCVLFLSALKDIGHGEQQMCHQLFATWDI